MLKQRIDYLLRSVANAAQEKKCPYCGSSELIKIDSKFLLTSLLKCQQCNLNHRHPKDDEKWLSKFYQKDYAIDTHMMTLLPSDNEIEKYKSANFASLRSFEPYVEALFKKKEGVRIIDYGCSWGYNVYQLIKSGYKTVGYELSVPRAEFGRAKLRVPIYTDTTGLPKENDLILSSHVIEHLSNIGKFVSLSRTLLKKDGLFVAFCPNGSEAYAEREPAVWHVNWGAVHPNYLTIEFARYVFKDNPYLLLTGDWEFDPVLISDWDGKSQKTDLNKAGKELLIISKPNAKI